MGQNPSNLRRPAAALALLMTVTACGGNLAAPTTIALVDGSQTAERPPTTTTTPSTTTSSASFQAQPTSTIDTSQEVSTFNVDIGGRSMFMECRGTTNDTPTVVVDAWSSGAVSALVRAVAETTRVCTYDHAGTRRSDPPPELPRSAQAYADDLHALLVGSGLAGPYVFVPWSNSDWTTILYAQSYPDDMAGIVMIDPRGPSVSSSHLAALPEPTPDEATAITENRNFLLDLIARPGESDGEGLDWPTSEGLSQKALDTEGPLFGNRPVIILSGADTKQQWLFDLPQETQDKFWEIWLNDQRRLADESTRGEWRVVEGSAHEIHGDQLQAVVDAINEVVDESR